MSCFNSIMTCLAASPAVPLISRPISVFWPQKNCRQWVNTASLFIPYVYISCGSCCTFTDCSFCMSAEIIYQKMAVSSLTCWIRSFCVCHQGFHSYTYKSLGQSLTSILRCNVDFVLFGSMEVKQKHLFRTKFWFLCFSVSVARTVCGIIKTYNREWISSICSWCGW